MNVNPEGFEKLAVYLLAKYNDGLLKVFETMNMGHKVVQVPSWVYLYPVQSERKGGCREEARRSNNESNQRNGR